MPLMCNLLISWLSIETFSNVTIGIEGASSSVINSMNNLNLLSEFFITSAEQITIIIIVDDIDGAFSTCQALSIMYSFLYKTEVGGKTYSNSSVA
jgi:hypothetical protein